MTLKQRIRAFARMGDFVDRHDNGNRQPGEDQLHTGLDKVIEIAYTYNNWFIPQFVNESIRSLKSFLDETTLAKFTERFTDSPEQRTVAVICAGNIPLVCFHDLMCVLLSGHKALIKLSGDDKVLMPFFLRLLVHYEPAFESSISFAEGKLSNFNAVIATGSDNTASHLHYYFRKYPNIIRKSRTSMAVLTGNETTEELKDLGKDIFLYFGLGCRNVSKLLVPKEYSFNKFFESIVDFGFVVNNNKYGNNYDYHRAIYLLEQIPFLDNNFLMIRETRDLYSPVGVLYYEFYDGQTDIGDYVKAHEHQLQCVVGRNYVPLGYSQRPVITDFADNIDTVDFLVHL
jgi:hypothetical protein